MLDFGKIISHPADCNLERSWFLILFIIPTTFKFLLFNSETNPTEDNSSGETNDTELDESSENWWNDGDLTGEFVIGGLGLIGGGALGNIFGGPKGGKKNGSRFDITDAKDVYDFIADRKQDKKDKFPEPSGSDHYLRIGVARQEAMTISADINLDDYVEENDNGGKEK